MGPCALHIPCTLHMLSVTSLEGATNPFSGSVFPPVYSYSRSSSTSNSSSSTSPTNSSHSSSSPSNSSGSIGSNSPWPNIFDSSVKVSLSYNLEFNSLKYQPISVSLISLSCISPSSLSLKYSHVSPSSLLELSPSTSSTTIKVSSNGKSLKSYSVFVSDFDKDKILEYVVG